MKYKIYKITNIITGRLYIGQTKRSLDLRLKEHATNPNCRVLYRAIQKYGIENFTIDLIGECETFEELNKAEKYYINKWNTLAPHGYNIEGGGNSKKMVSKETRKILSKNIKERYKNGTQKPPNSDSGRSVICVETGKVFESPRLAGEWCNVNRTTITRAARGSTISAGGYTWEYTDPILKAESDKRRNSRDRARKPVKCLDNGKTFESAWEAEQWLGVAQGSVRKVCRGQRKSIKGLIFKFI